jgi:RNA polymerase sigma-70 factor (sigma-E family)
MDLDARATPDHPAGPLNRVHWPDHSDAAAAVTALYREHALSMIRLAHIMLGSRPAAEDVVHDAFCGLYRRWAHLADKGHALGYVRSSVLNGCRSVLRGGRVREFDDAAGHQPAVMSAELTVLSLQERRDVVAALRRLPGRQREVLVLRYYLDLPDEQVARDLGISASTVRSTRKRALGALGRSLKEGNS